MDATGVCVGKHVLDVGCGSGHSISMIKNAGTSVIGVDSAQGMVDYAARTFDGVAFRVGASNTRSSATMSLIWSSPQTRSNMLRTWERHSAN